MFKSEEAINEYARRGLLDDVERTVVKLVSIRQKWIVVGIVTVFIIYVVLAIWIGITTKNVKNDTFNANNLKRELAIKTDSLERVKIQEERIQIAEVRKTDSLKRIKLFEISDNYKKSIEEWKAHRKKKDE